jgi:hypothetical protein
MEEGAGCTHANLKKHTLLGDSRGERERAFTTSCVHAKSSVLS